MGFDISWSRVNVGRQWLREQSVEGHLFVADLFNIPLAENSIDLVYSCHSLEPNGGREKEAIRECLRVARNAVVLVEPSYELANAEARERMERHGYVKGLRQAAESLGARIAAFQLLKEIGNPLNPSGVLVLEKEGGTRLAPTAVPQWRCPISSAPLCDCGDVFAAPEVGLVYPVVREIPMLRGEHAIVASKLGSE